MVLWFYNFSENRTTISNGLLEGLFFLGVCIKRPPDYGCWCVQFMYITDNTIVVLLFLQKSDYYLQCLIGGPVFFLGICIKRRVMDKLVYILRTLRTIWFSAVFYFIQKSDYYLPCRSGGSFFPWHLHQKTCIKFTYTTNYMIFSGFIIFPKTGLLPPMY